MTFPNNKKWLIIGIFSVLASIGFIIFLIEVFQFGVDDSYIFFRYAENVANGHGFVFNPGEPLGEGFTSLIWLLFLAFANYTGLNIIIFSKVLGILSFLSAVFLFYITVIKLIGKSTASIVTALIMSSGMLLNFQLIAHSVSGMETPLYLFCIVLLLFLTTNAFRASRDHLYWWLILSAMTMLIFMVRPEGILAGGLALLALTLINIKSLKKGKTWLFLALGLIAPILFYFIWKLVVFGSLMPLSYYHKFIVRSEEYNDSLRHLLRFGKAYGWMFALAVPSIIFFNKKSKGERGLYLFYGAFFIIMVGVYLFFYPAMNYLHRFYISYLPLLLLMILPLISYLVKQSFRLSNLPMRLLVILGIIGLLFVGLNIELDWSKKRVKNWSNMVNPKIYRAKLGKLMAQLPREVKVANSEMGVIPYYSGLTCIDMAGLTDPHIAHNGLTMDYLLKRRVELIIFHKNVDNVSMRDWNKYTLNYKNVFLSEYFDKNYELLCSFAAWPGGKKKYFLYVDKTSSNYSVIKEWCEENSIHFSDFE